MQPKFSELAWHIGITRSAVSSRVSPMSSAVMSDNSAMVSWLRMAALGLPVVPEVYMSAHVSVGLTSIPGSRSEPRPTSAS